MEARSLTGVHAHYQLYSARRTEQEESEYQKYFGRCQVTAEDVSVPRAPTNVKTNPGEQWYMDRLDERHRSRYFNAFYESFTKSKTQFFASQLAQVCWQEGHSRVNLRECAHAELVSICQGVAPVLEDALPALLAVNELGPADAETIERGLIVREYFSMLIDVCRIEETLARRHIVLSEEALARETIDASEVPQWIEARRLEMDRERASECCEAEEERSRRIAYFCWKQQQLYQAFLLEQSESNDRQTLERRERLDAGAIAGQHSNSMRSARYAQLRYEDTLRALDAETSRCITALEATHRSEVLVGQHDCFRCLGALEVRSYLATTRHQMENEYMEMTM